MAELGGHTQAAHEEIGRRAAELRLGALYTVGRMAAVTAAAARSGGLSAVFEFADAAGAGRALAAELLPGDLVLLKASRAARLEQVGEFLKNNVI
jgi:UDP-N-acetylmuramoyl-tripeptide--D-alanyl-D-alanine ligase